MTRGPDQLATPDPTVNLTDISLQPASELTPAELLAHANSLRPDERLWLMAAVWCALPTSHPVVPSPVKQRELQGYLDDYAGGRIAAFPWQTVQGLMAGGAYIKSAKIYSVPRRFDLATIFVVTLAYSLLFGAMSALSFPPTASAIVAGFILLVGAAQAFLFGGKRPRNASIIAGAVLFLLSITAVWMVLGRRFYGTAELLVTASFTTACGGMLGYLSGVIIGGVFLVADKLRNRFSPRPAELNVDAIADGCGTTGQRDNPWTS
jgi:hypothetical protein